MTAPLTSIPGIDVRGGGGGGGGGGGVLASGWTSVPAGTTQPVAANGMYAADSTGALVTFTLPSGPADGTATVIKLVGATVLQPVKIQAGAGDVVEDPQNAGVFSAVAGAVFVPTPGSSVGLKYQAGGARWIAFII